ncbi:MAG TPA: sigma 54-interacting transcriptional regulator [Polyangiaceae bacterium]
MRNVPALPGASTDEDGSTLTGASPALGGTMVAIPRLLLTVLREGGKAGNRTVELEGERVRVGSHPSNELIVTDRLVSRFHCMLTLERGQWTITDTESLNGTLLLGVRVREAILPPGECEIAIGDSVVRVTQLSPEKVTRVPPQTSFGDLHGRTLAMRQVFSMLERVAASDATVLVHGESGTGKELVASEIARRSPRRGKPFLTVDCGAISPNLVESELFGHARGAFTGADRARIGAFEAADHGTIFLDEIGEMPLEMQPKLLRVLENREVRRAGENEARKVNVRVIAATNRNLEREVNRGRFREDLYFRLSVFTVRLPPLRERADDIPDLVRALLERMGAPDGARLFTPQILAELAQHEWPGNVRELRNYVERAVVLQDATSPSHALRAPTVPEAAGELHGEVSIEAPFKTAKEALIAGFERAYLEQLMAWAGGNVSRASRKAKLDRMYLHRLLQRYGLKRDEE